jgi:hypothetical protein
MGAAGRPQRGRPGQRGRHLRRPADGAEFLVDFVAIRPAASRRRPSRTGSCEGVVEVRKQSPFKWLALVAVAAISGLLAVFLSVDAKQRGELGLELGKGLIQLLVVVVVGAAVKLLVDHYQYQQQQAEQNRQFRQDKYDRLVQATNELRRVPILINANRSVKTWNKQMLAVIDASLTLRMIKHQISSSGNLDDSGRNLDELPFPDHEELVHLFELMYQYTDWVITDFKDHKKELSELQRQAEESGLSAQEKAHRQDTVWDRILMLDSVADMLKKPSQKESEDNGEDGATSQATEKPSWVTYEVAQDQALERITRATLTKQADATNGPNNTRHGRPDRRHADQLRAS